jgi:hypothetical protein
MLNLLLKDVCSKLSFHFLSFNYVCLCSTGIYDWTKINKMTYLSGNKAYPVIIPCPVFDNYELKLYRGPYIDAYCQDWFHLAKLFQRRRLNQRLSRACIVHLVIKKNNWSYVCKNYKINSFFWLANVKKIFSSETAWPNGAKLGIDGPWVCPFQNCVQQPHRVSKKKD